MGVAGLDGLTDEADEELVLGLAEPFDDAGEEDGTADEEEGALEEKAVLLGDGVLLGRHHVADERADGKGGSGEEQEGGDAHVAEGDLLIGIASGAVIDEEAEAEEEADGKRASGNGAIDDHHDLVEFLGFAKELENGDVGDDEGDDEENRENDNNEGGIVESEVGRGEAIEPNGIKEAEDRDKVTNGDIGAKGTNDKGIFLRLDHGKDGVNKAVEGHEQTGESEGAEHQRKSKTHFGKRFDRAFADPEIRGDQEAEVDGEVAESSGQQRAHDDVDQSNGGRVFHNMTSLTCPLARVGRKSSPNIKVYLR